MMHGSRCILNIFRTVLIHPLMQPTPSYISIAQQLFALSLPLTRPAAARLHHVVCRVSSPRRPSRSATRRRGSRASPPSPRRACWASSRPRTSGSPSPPPSAPRWVSPTSTTPLEAPTSLFPLKPSIQVFVTRKTPSFCVRSNNNYNRIRYTSNQRSY